MNQITQYNLWFRGGRVKKIAGQERGGRVKKIAGQDTFHVPKNKLNITRMK